MTDLKMKITEEYGQVNGIIHSAGVPGGGIIQEKTRESASEIIAAKVFGTLILDENFQDEDLDFFISMSSLTAVLGGFGQVDYTAANAFLDAFSYSKNRSSNTLTMSINWDAWTSSGMAV